MGTYQLFSSARDLGAVIGIEAVERPNGVAFGTEADWGIYRGAGFGRTEFDDGWLVTFAMARSSFSISLDESSREPGAIIAHEIVGDRKTGRCLLLTASVHGFGPVLTEGDGDKLLKDAGRQPWFRDQIGGAHVNVETELLPWL